MDIVRTREEAIFNSARRIADPAERAAWLRESCGDDAALLARIEALLAVHDEQQSFLEPRAVCPQTIDMRPIAERPGTVIGPYKLLEQIGEGGFGVVFMAEQLAPVRRKVALKVIKPGMDTRQVIARFDAERQALAVMDHPNIAHVFEAGATESGRPYFVMELVRGSPITAYCDESNLPVRERLELFASVCQAIQHAHTKGIIHRDVKPTNVLVTRHDGRAVVKIIDFGIAKAMGQQLTEKTLFTEFAQMVGTPLYMSPEQAELSSVDIDTRSDIYSLGVLLYELLTGSTPVSSQQLKQAGFDEIRRIIREDEPQRPSLRISGSGALASIAAHRHIEPARLSKLVRGELDWIVMKALEKDRGRRYETANSFAMDVQRYLADEQVLACPPSAIYRLRKFARRNTRALASAAVLGMMLFLGMVLLVLNNVQIKKEQQRTAAEKTRAEAALVNAKQNLGLADQNLGLALQALDDVYMNEIEKRVLQKRQLSPADREFLQKGLRFYEQFGQRNGTHAELQGATAKANRRAGYLRLELSQWQEAEQHFRRAIPLLEKLVAESPTAPVRRRESASSLHGLSVALGHVGPLHDAETTSRQAVASWQELASEFPAERDYRVELGHSLWHLQWVLSRQGRHQEAEGPVREALKLFEQLKVEFPEEMYFRQETARSRVLLADSLKAQGGFPEAQENFQHAVVLYAGLAAEAPENLFYWHELANAHSGLGGVLKHAGRTQEAEEAYRQAVSHYEKLVQKAPQAVDYRVRLAWSQGELVHLLSETGRLPEAELYCRLAMEIYRQLLAEDRAEPEYWDLLARQTHVLARLLHAAGRPGEVEQAYAQAVQAYRQALPLYRKRAADSITPWNRWRVADCLGWLGEAHRQAGQPDEAIKVWRASVPILEKLVADFSLPTDVGYLAIRLEQLGDLSMEIGRHEEAETDYRDSLAVWKKLVADYNRPEDHPSLTRIQAHLTAALVQQGKIEQAIASDPETVQLDPKSAGAHNTLGVALWKHGKRDEALACYQRALEIDPKLAKAHSNLGLALGAQRKLDEAIACYQRAIEIDPKLAPAHNNLGIALYGQEKLDDALACFRKAAELAPQSILNSQYMGWAEYRAGNWNASIEALEKSCTLQSGGDCGQWIVLALAYWQLAAQPGLAEPEQAGHRQKARDWYNRAVQQIDGHPGLADQTGQAIRAFRAEARELMGADDDKKPTAEKQIPPLLPVRSQWQQEMQRRAEVLNVRRVDLLPQPLHRYSDPARSVHEAMLWAWGRTGRPVALAAMEVYSRPGAGAEATHEFLSLADGPISAEGAAGKWRWSPQSPGIVFHEFPGAEPALDDAVKRLKQMQDLAKRFTALEDVGPDGKSVELRLLPDPIHRYADPGVDLLDGAIFVLAHGDNPEIVLLLEAGDPGEPGTKWRYGLARLSAAKLSVHLDGRETWKQPATGKTTPQDIYWIVSEPMTPE